MSRFFYISILSFLLSAFFCCGQGTVADSLDTEDPMYTRMRIGFCAKKMMGFYWVNGLTLVTNDSIYGAPVTSGVNITSSLLGSSVFSDALPLHMFELFSYYRFRSKKKLQPFAGILLGAAFAHYSDPVFKHLQQAQALISPEFGIGYKFEKSWQASASFGYYLITGNGPRGVGLVYPLFGQLRVTYDL